jgi:hypothetical protein
MAQHLLGALTCLVGCDLEEIMERASGDLHRADSATGVSEGGDATAPNPAAKAPAKSLAASSPGVGDGGATPGPGTAVDAPTEGESWARCQAAWDKARQGLEVREIAAPGEPIRWKIQEGCDLRYDFRAEFLMEPDSKQFGPPLEFGLLLVGGAKGVGENHDGSRLALRSTAIEIGHVVEGIRSPALKQAEGGIAPILLRTDGRSMTEEDGPTSLWSAFGTWPGWVLFFPTLPDGAEAGSEGRWEISVYPRGAGAAVEARRGTLELPPGTQLPTATPIKQDAKVRLVRWVEIGGQPAAIIGVRWVEDREGKIAPPDFPVELAARTRGVYEGHYVVLVGGRLLHAAIHGEAAVSTVSASQEGEPNHMDQRQSQWSEARLVSACEGPTLNTFEEPAFSIGERGIATYRNLQSALREGDQNAAEALIHPRLKRAHRAGAVYRLLRDHVERHSPDILGSAEMTREVELEGATARFLVNGHMQVDPDARFNVDTTVTVEAAGDEVLITGLRSNVRDSEVFEVLVVTPERLFSAPPF